MQQQYDGIDVSVYQGTVNFQAVSQAGIEIVYIRAGTSPDRIDTKFEVNARKALDAGLHTGFYYYLRARTTEDAASQARRFHSLIAGKTFDCRPAMDYETFPGLTREQINENAAAFLKTLQGLLGYAPLLYSDAYRVRTLWNSSLNAYPLWIAEYGVDRPKTTGAWETWSGFQYSDAGSIPGIQGRVDLDHFRSSVFIQDPSPEPAPDRYTVQPGDTLWGIAKAHNTTVTALAELNGIVNPSLIYPGQQLLIPSGGQGSYFLYRVQKGDTLSEIALRHNTTIEILVDLNQIADPNRIYPGEILKIPRA